MIFIIYLINIRRWMESNRFLLWRIATQQNHTIVTTCQNFYLSIASPVLWLLCHHATSFDHTCSE